MEYHKGVVKMDCYFCEVKPAISTKFGKPACDTCNFDEYLTIENPVTARKRTDEQNAQRQKMMKMAFDHTFNECWYCDDELATEIKFGQKICDTCSSKGKVIRTSAPVHLMDEYEKATHLKIGICMSEVGRKANEGKPNEIL